MQQEADMAETKTNDPEFVKVFHPTIDGVTNDVPSDTVEAWQAQGWLKSKPSNPSASV